MKWIDATEKEPPEEEKWLWLHIARLYQDWRIESVGVFPGMLSIIPGYKTYSFVDDEGFWYSASLRSEITDDDSFDWRYQDEDGEGHAYVNVCLSWMAAPEPPEG